MLWRLGDFKIRKKKVPHPIDGGCCGDQNLKRTKMVLELAVARQTRSVWFIILINK